MASRTSIETIDNLNKTHLNNHSSHLEDVDIENAQNGEANEHELKQTIISLVLDASQDEELGPRPVWFEVSSLLSCIYALLVTLLGLIFPIVEATDQRWLNEPVTGVFYVYIFLVGTAFLLYLQYVTARHTPHEEEEEDIMSEHKPRHPYSQGYVIKSYKEENPLDAISSEVLDTDNNLSQYQNGIHVNKFPPGTPEDPSGYGKEIGSTTKDATVSFHPHRLTRSLSLGNEPPDIPNTTKTHRNSVSFELVNKRWRHQHDHDVSMVDFEGLRGMFGHDGSSFYLRLGTLVFGIGNVIYVALELQYHFSIHTCKARTMSWIFILQLLFILVQTFFIFKNPQIHLGSGASLARAGLMHLVATNVCVWSRTLVSEVLNELLHHHNTEPGDSNFTTTAPGFRSGQEDDECEIEGPLMSSASPYLFPFVLEYSLIAMATAAVMFSSLADKTDQLVIQNIHQVVQANLGLGNSPVSCHSSEHVERSSLLSKSHRGMFLGFMLLTGSVISMVMFFFAADELHDNVEARIIYLSCDMINHFCLLVAAIIAFLRIRHMSFKTDRALSIDDLLILMAMAGSFLFELTIVISTSSYISEHHTSPDIDVILALVAAIIAGLQTVIQVILVLASMRLYSSTKSQVAKMPGRGTFTFLLVGNVAVWLFRSVQVKELEMGIQEDFYGHIVWIIITNLSLPLLLFFRFHSSVCFADIWDMAYKLKKT